MTMRKLTTTITMSALVLAAIAAVPVWSAADAQYSPTQSSCIVKCVREGGTKDGCIKQCTK